MFLTNVLDGLYSQGGVLISAEGLRQEGAEPAPRSHSGRDLAHRAVAGGHRDRVHKQAQQRQGNHQHGNLLPRAEEPRVYFRQNRYWI